MLLTDNALNITAPGAVVGFQASSWAPCYIDLEWSAPSSSLPVSQYVLSVYQNTTCVQQIIISGTPVSHFVTDAPSSVAANSTTTQPNIKVSSTLFIFAQIYLVNNNGD
jgi:hypothetical protein